MAIGILVPALGTETLAPAPATPSPVVAPAPVGRMVLPVRALLIAVAGFGLGALAPGPVVAAGAAAGLPVAALLALAVAGQWGPMVGACWLCSRIWGRGRLRADYGLAVAGHDVRFGLRAWAGAWVTAMVLGTAFAALGANTLRSDDRIFAALVAHPASLALLVVIVVVGAPVVEELFFRGLVQSSLGPVLGTAGAIVVQGLLFGLAHHPRLADSGELAAVITLAAVGMVLGVVAHRRRLGTTIVGHSLFNAVSVAGRLL